MDYRQCKLDAFEGCKRLWRLLIDSPVPFSTKMKHNYDFDPTYGYNLTQLKTVPVPPEPEDFDAFWSRRYDAAIKHFPESAVRDTGRSENGWNIFNWSTRSTGGFQLGGWLLVPQETPVERGFIVGHGYGGIDGPRLDLPLKRAALLFPCLRGIGQSRCKGISEEPQWHVLHDIDNRDRYVLGGCVEDVWVSVSSLLRLFPMVSGRVGFLGVSFTGGIGAMALPWEKRIARAHLNVPSFGNQPLRMQLPSAGSAESVQRFFRKNAAAALHTLAYHDAAVSARRIKIPMHFACALFDPFVAPPGQFAVHNAVPGAKELFVLDAGHHDYPGQAKQERELAAELETFFGDL